MEPPPPEGGTVRSGPFLLPPGGREASYQAFSIQTAAMANEVHPAQAKMLRAVKAMGATAENARVEVELNKKKVNECLFGVAISFRALSPDKGPRRLQAF